MKIGKVPERVLKRSVLKYLKPNNEYMKKGAAIGADCALFSKNDRTLAIATASVSGEKGNLQATHAILRACNNLAAEGASPFAVQLHVMLPERYREIALKRIMEAATDTAGSLRVTISGGHTETLPDIQTPIVSVTALGYQDKDTVSAKISPGQEIIMSKWIGIGETARLAREREEELLTRYPAFFIKSAQNLEQYYSILPEAATAVKSGVSMMHDVAGGGIFGALWELGEKAGVGLQIHLKKIPIKQETVEICEFFGYNPYEMRSDGAMLFITDEGHTLVEALRSQGIEAEVIGVVTDDNDKVIINEEEKRFLEPPGR